MRISDWSSDVCSSDLPQGGIAAVEFLDLILGEIADAHLARRGHGAVLGLQLRREQPRERRLPVAVAAEQRDAVVGVDPQVEAREHRRTRRITDAREVERDQRRLQFVAGAREIRSEEHTSELQSLMRISYAVFCLKT